MMEVATWDNCRADFTFDGGLIDLLVPGTGSAEWEQFWSALRGGPFSVQAYRDDEQIPLPESAAWAIAEREVGTIMVSVLSGSITANCHFFGGDLEMNIDPREIVTAVAFESLLSVMRFVAATVGKTVFAVAEGGTPELAFLQVSPNGQSVYCDRR